MPPRGQLAAAMPAAATADHRPGPAAGFSAAGVTLPISPRRRRLGRAPPSNRLRTRSVRRRRSAVDATAHSSCRRSGLAVALGDGFCAVFLAAPLLSRRRTRAPLPLRAVTLQFFAGHAASLPLSHQSHRNFLAPSVQCKFSGRRSRNIPQMAFERFQQRPAIAAQQSEKHETILTC